MKCFQNLSSTTIGDLQNLLKRINSLGLSIWVIPRLSRKSSRNFKSCFPDIGGSWVNYLITILQIIPSIKGSFQKTFIDLFCDYKIGLLRGVFYFKPLTNEKSHSETTHRMVLFRSPILLNVWNFNYNHSFLNAVSA